MRTLALPEAVKHWSLASLREKLVKIAAKIVTHARPARGIIPSVPRGLGASTTAGKRAFLAPDLSHPENVDLVATNAAEPVVRPPAFRKVA